ncbi:MAG: LytTR family transcriptional regulator DNA-binding domain-containing protein [bacterium]|nr:LytTR family transcriptional regulator DNA-binding domain-containing protein [bacterium]
MKAFLVDDEHLARERMKSLLSHSTVSIEITGESGVASEAIELINASKPDVVFLDIQMPGLDGFDVVSMLEKPRPYIIFVTAYDEFAIKAFDVFALDYLTKPVRLERLNKSLERLKNVAEQKSLQNASIEKVIEEQKQKPLHVLTGKKGRSIHILDINEVQYLEANEKLIYAYTDSAKFRIDGTLDQLEQRLTDGRFVRTHRSFLVNVTYVSELIPWFSGSYEIKLTSGKQLSVSRRRVKDVKAQLGI